MWAGSPDPAIFVSPRGDYPKRQGTRRGLQFHVRKDKSQLLHSLEAKGTIPRSLLWNSYP